MKSVLDNIERLAKEATPGPWEAMPPPAPSHSDHGYRAITKPWRSRDPCGVYALASNMVKPGEGLVWGADAAYIAAANPAAVLAMVAVCREALEHIESMDAYEGGDLVPMNRTRGTTARLRSAIEALDAMQKEGAKG
jgi:hypothetical protein